MRLTWLAVSGLVTVLMRSSPSVEASFLRDVVGHHAPVGDRQAIIEDALLAKAVPLNEYKAKLAARGLQVEENPRHLQEEEEAAEAADDYYLSAEYMYSFSGYSLKYAKCQPVQRFSEDAIMAGEYTPMVTDDIVILRLCPYRFCSGSRMFGCHYNYAEYAIDLSDYIRVMIRYKYDKMTQLCNWCDSCYARRKLEDGDANGDEEADYAAMDDGTQNSYYYNDDAVSNESGACFNYQTHCTDSSGNSLCQADDDTYMNGMEYLDYIYCARITDKDNYSYYVRPRCNGYDQTIKMAVFYDSFCSQYAGNEVSLKNFNLGFQESAFSEFYDGNSCLDCSESNNPPFFDANSTMCNRMHVSGAKCSTNMQYDLFQTDSDESTECAFIESVRFGTYDEKGQLYLDGSIYGNSANRQVTDGQKAALSVSAVICALLALYSCYLHHSITNLLIKSLSHTDLLPPSRHKSSRRSTSSTRKARRGRKSRADDEDSDWDMVGTPA